MYQRRAIAGALRFWHSSLKMAEQGIKRPRADAPKLFPIFQRRRLTPSSAAETLKDTTAAEQESSTPPQIFCDLDGVLVDFDAGVAALRQLHATKGAGRPFLLWPRIRATPQFYRTLPWTKDGRRLWAALAPRRPHILTGVPWNTGSPAARDKYDWCQRELTLPDTTKWQWRHMAGTKKTHVRVNLHRPEAVTKETTTDADLPAVITCWSQNKVCECRRPGDVLIDDRPENHDLQRRWEAAGGVFVHHTSAASTIQALVELGILKEEEEITGAEREEKVAMEQETANAGTAEDSGPVPSATTASDAPAVEDEAAAEERPGEVSSSGVRSEPDGALTPGAKDSPG